jgi:MoaA/NifB/PqqE/SkfB family radical SAM enzyme
MKKAVRNIRSFFRVLRRIWIDGRIRQGRRKKIPQTIIIEPTNFCNLKCSCCPQGNNVQGGRAQGLMNRETFLKIWDNIDFPIKEVCLYLHGEPFLNKDLDFFVSQTDKRKGVLTTLYSNGYNIDIELLRKVLSYKKNRFSFSMDLINKEKYEQIRLPAMYEKAIESLRQIDKTFTEYNRKYELNIIVDEKTGTDIEVCDTLFSQFKQLRKITFTTKFPWPEHFHTGDLSEHIAKRRMFCKQITGGVSVYWNGDVTICSYDFSGKLIIGNLTETRLSEIYNSLPARRIRKWHYLNRLGKLPICEACLLPRFVSKTIIVNRPKAKRQ